MKLLLRFLPHPSLNDQDYFLKSNICRHGCGEERNFLTTSGGENWCDHYGIQRGGSSGTWKQIYHRIQWAYSQRTLHPYCRDTCSSVFTNAPYTIAQKLSQPTVHQVMNRQQKCGIFTHHNIQAFIIKLLNLQLNGWN